MMDMPRALLLALVAWVACASTATAAQSAFDALLTECQEQLYYELETLPPTVTRLIAAPPAVAEAIACYDGAKDEYVKFNVVLILDKQVRAGGLSAEVRARALAFFRTCLEHGNPWIKTETVFALGNAQGKEALPAIMRCFDDDDATVVFHAVISYVTITGEKPDLNQQQVERFDVARKASAAGNGGLNRLADQELARYVAAAPY